MPKKCHKSPPKQYTKAQKAFFIKAGILYVCVRHMGRHEVLGFSTTVQDWDVLPSMSFRREYVNYGDIVMSTGKWKFFDGFVYTEVLHLKENRLIWLRFRKEDFHQVKGSSPKAKQALRRHPEAK